MSLIKNLIRWARVTAAGSDDKQFATQQVKYLGKTADSTMVSMFGFHYNATPDSFALMFAVQGNPDNRAAMAWAPKNRPTLASGEVAFYHPPTDAFIIWKASGDLEIETGTGGTAEINIKAATVNITADVNIIGDTTFTGTVMANGKVIDDTHTHVGSATAPTGAQVNTGAVV